jgi:murein DD-endopeptidase MepM/ murein hydrolase activator NlpD
MHLKGILAASLAIFVLAGCAVPAGPQPIAATTSSTPTPDSSPIPTSTPTNLPTPSLAPTAALTATPSTSAVSSPLAGVQLTDLAGIVSNPFAAPLPGRDDGHHGVDLAFYRWGDQVGMLGTSIHSVLDGKVAAASFSSYPYGNFVIIETGWDQLPPGIQGKLAAPSPPTPEPQAIRLTCPSFLDFGGFPEGHPSLYLLYAHMQEPSPLAVGDTVMSGEPIGKVGTSGASVNPHLHLETRAGPPGATFTEMAHYDAAVSELARKSYCTWRVSGEFELFNPMDILAIAEEK